MSLAEQSQQWFPTSVQVTVLQARGLRSKGKNGTNDAYAIMQVAKEKFSTSVAEKSVGPVWKEQAAFDLPVFRPGDAERVLQVCVMHRALVGPDKLLGQVTVNLLELQDDTSRNKTEWFKLMGKAGKADKDRGEVLLDVQFMKNNMTASMYDLSGQDKSRSRLGKIKDKLKGKKKDGLSDSASAVVSSYGQVLTDSEGEEEHGAMHGAKKKNKLKSLFAPKPGLHRNLSQSMSTLGSLPETDSAVSLNLESPEGKKKFKFLKHKRTGSSDSKVSQGTGSLGPGTAQGSVCINGSHVYTEETRASRTGSTFSLSSSGLGSMEDLRRAHDRKTSSTSADSSEPAQDTAEEDMHRRQEEHRKQEEEVQERLEEDRRRAEDEERKRTEREQEENRKRLEREEEKRKLEKQEEERKRIEREEERKRIEKEEERKRVEREEERKRIEREEERKRMEMEEEKRKLEKQEENRKRIEREQEENRKRIEREQEEERKRMEMEEEKRKLEKQEENRKRIEREQEENRKRIEREQEENRKRIEREQEEERKRMEMEEEKRKLEKQEEERRRRIEQEEMIRIKKEQELVRQEEERRKAEEYRKRMEEEEKARKEEDKRRRTEEEERTRLENEKLQKEEETRKREMDRRRAEEEDRLVKEKEKTEAEEEERRLSEERERKEQERVRQEKEKLELANKRMEERIREEQVRREEEEEKRKLKEKEERIRREKEEMERQKKEKEQQPAAKPRSARLNTSKKASDEINSDHILSTNPFKDPLLLDESSTNRFKDPLLLDESSTNPFEQPVVSPPEARSTKVSAVKPSSSVSGLFFSQASVPNTNPFFDDSQNAAERSEKKRRAPMPPQNKNKPDVSPKAPEATQAFPSKTSEDDGDCGLQRDKRPAPLPPKNKQEPVQTGERRTSRFQKTDRSNKECQILQEESRTSAEASFGNTSLSHLIQGHPKNTQETNSFISTEVKTTKHNKGPAPKPSLRSQSCKTPASETETSNVLLPEHDPSAASNSCADQTDDDDDDEEEPSAEAEHAHDLSSREGELDSPSVSDPVLGEVRCSENDPRNAENVLLERGVSGKKSRAPLPPAKAASSRQPEDARISTGQPRIRESLTVNSSTSASCSTQSLVNSSSTFSQSLSPLKLEAGQGSDLRRVPQARVSPVDVQPIAGQKNVSDRERAADSKPCRPHAVKPLSSADQQPDVRETRDTARSAKITDDMQVKMKAPEAKRTGPYSQLTHEELINVLEKQKQQLSQKDAKIGELEQYIDNLLVRVMEESPSILMSLNSMKKSV